MPSRRWVGLWLCCASLAACGGNTTMLQDVPLLGLKTPESGGGEAKKLGRFHGKHCAVSVFGFGHRPSLQKAMINAEAKAKEPVSYWRDVNSEVELTAFVVALRQCWTFVGDAYR